MPQPSTRSTQPYDEAPYAWTVVWACFCALAVIFGVSYSFAAFFAPFTLEFQAQRADVSLVFGLSGLIYFLLGAGAGMLADRYGPRAVTCSGMVLIAAGLLASSFATSLAQVMLAYGVGIGLGVGLVYAPAIACVQPWFQRRRGLAAGLASAGIGAGTLVVPLLAAWAIETWEWRVALRLLAAGVLILGLGATLLLRRAPVPAVGSGEAGADGGKAEANAGSGGNGEGDSKVAGNSSSSVSVSSGSDSSDSSNGNNGNNGSHNNGLSLRQALRSPKFIWLYVMTALSAPSMFIPFAHVSAAARDLGINAGQAVGLVGLIGIGSLSGRFAIGALADRIGRPVTLVLMQACLGLSFLLWWQADAYPAMLVFALWMGVSYGGIVSLLPALCMDFFGARAVASIIGTLYTAAALGNLAGPYVAGWAFDATGSYATVIWGCLLLSALATGTAWLSVRPAGLRNAA